MTVALPFILQILQMVPQIASAGQMLAAIFHHPAVTIVDSAGVPVSSTVLKDLQDAATSATASAITGVQVTGA